jgi:hypothetical protein
MIIGKLCASEYHSPTLLFSGQCERRYGMNTHKIITRNYAGWLLAVAVLFLFAQVSVSHGAGRLLARPVDGGVAQSQTNVSLEPYEVRKGRIALALEIVPGVSNRQAEIAVFQGDTDTASISFFADVTYDVIVDSVKHQGDGTMIINGKLKGHTMETVVMTIGPDGFLMTVQDMKKGLLYRVTGDSRQGSGTVTEIDMQNMPPMIR